MSSADFFLSLRVVVGITCIISIFGACVIIFTYVAFKDLRTLARQQLVNLSAADIIVAASHLVGLVALRVEDYGASSGADTFDNTSNISNSSAVQGTLCRVQAGFTMCGTIASFLWSLALGFYMLVIIVLRRPNFARYLILVYYPVCWGVPVALTLWFALVKPTYLGFVDSADIGWCYIRFVPNSEGKNDHKASLIAQLLGYELWFYITVVFLVVIYLTMLCYLKCRGLQLLRQRPQARRSTDIKLIFVPLIFFLLRVWSALIDIPTFYFSHERHPYGEGATHTLVAIAGIGDSAQGLANAILFCLLTKHVRQELVRSARSYLCCHCRETNSELQSTQQLSSSPYMNIISALETTTQFEDSNRSRYVDRMATEEISSSDTTGLLKDSSVTGDYGTNFDHLR